MAHIELRQCLPEFNNEMEQKCFLSFKESFELYHYEEEIEGIYYLFLCSRVLSFFPVNLYLFFFLSLCPMF